MPCCFNALSKISIHALREEGDFGEALEKYNAKQFLSTPSARRATCYLCLMISVMIFLSTPSARRAT